MLHCVIFVLFGCSVCYGFFQYENSNFFENDINYFNPDDSSEITRPCYVYDLYCIRHFFKEHSHCAIVEGPVPDPYYRSQSNVYAPRVKLSVTLTNIEITGLNGRIEEFYYNKQTNNLVIAIEFRGLSITSNSTYFTFHRRAKEPVVTLDYATIIYQSVVMTAIIPNLKELQLDQAEITVYVNDDRQPFSLGPKLAISSDPLVPATVVEFVDDEPTDVKELFLSDAPFYASTYIQNNLCDFGLKVV